MFRVQAFRHGPCAYGIQFHPEVVHSPYGKQVLENFLFRIANLLPPVETPIAAARWDWLLPSRPLRFFDS